jgi:hypothetical protein
MRTRAPYVDPLEKPPELLEADLAGRVTSPLHPSELLSLKALVPETKAAPGPIEDFHLIPTSISEKKQRARKNIHPKFHFHNRGQAINRLSEVHVIPIQENLADLITRMHQWLRRSMATTNPTNQCGSGWAGNSSSISPTRNIHLAGSETIVSVTLTAINPDVMLTAESAPWDLGT